MAIFTDNEIKTSNTKDVKKYIISNGIKKRDLKTFYTLFNCLYSTVCTFSFYFMNFHRLCEQKYFLYTPLKPILIMG